jgi:hypothetical protein
MHAIVSVRPESLSFSRVILSQQQNTLAEGATSLAAAPVCLLGNDVAQA